MRTPTDSKRPLRAHRTVLFSGVTLLLCLILLTLGGGWVHAFNSGIYGFSGAGPIGEGSGATCSFCHSSPGDYRPAVSIVGVDEVEAGSTTEFEVLLVDGSASMPAEGGYNLAIADGTLDTIDTFSVVGGDLGDGELTHDGTQDFAAGQITWGFEWEAPDEPGDYTMYVASVAANGMMGNSGDNVATNTFTVSVVFTPKSFLRGDADADGTVDAMADALFIFEWGFLDAPTPLCLDAVDVDDDGVCNPLLDGILLILWAFEEGVAPADPGPDVCGFDPIEGEGDLDGVSCDENICELD